MEGSAGPLRFAAVSERQDLGKLFRLVPGSSVSCLRHLLRPSSICYTHSLVGNLFTDVLLVLEYALILSYDLLNSTRFYTLAPTQRTLSRHGCDQNQSSSPQGPSRA